MIGDFSLLADAGFLISDGADLDVVGRRAATYVDKIFRGASPGELAIERPTVFELTVNMNTARAIGVSLPKEFLARETRLIG